MISTDALIGELIMALSSLLKRRDDVCQVERLGIDHRPLHSARLRVEEAREAEKLRSWALRS